MAAREFPLGNVSLTTHSVPCTWSLTSRFTSLSNPISLGLCTCLVCLYPGDDMIRLKFLIQMYGSQSPFPPNHGEEVKSLSLTTCKWKTGQLSRSIEDPSCCHMSCSKDFQGLPTLAVQTQPRPPSVFQLAYTECPSVFIVIIRILYMRTEVPEICGQFGAEQLNLMEIFIMV